jgi:alanine racemase
MRNQSTLQVDLSSVAHNCRAIRSHIGSKCKFCAVVKADGYGLGAIRLSSTLSQHADMLAVYSADEAGTLLAAGIRSDILVLAPTYDVDRFHPLYGGIMEGSVHLVIHGEDQLKAVMQMASRFGSVIRVQVKVDTGLRRGGCDPKEADRLIHLILNDNRLSLTGIMTHFSSAVHDEEMTRLQHSRLDQLIEPLATVLQEDCCIHEANTAATMQWRWTHRDMIRVGLAWTGTVPSPLVGLDAFRPVVSWTAHIAHIRSVKKGEQVGYGGTWRATRGSLIGVIPLGYAAGYPMRVGADIEGNGSFVHVLTGKNNEPVGEAPVIGAVCMDQIAIDLTDLPTNKIQLGCKVELLSTRSGSRASLSNVAIAAGVVPHAVISRISSSKVHRTYRNEGVQVEFPTKQKTIFG